MLYQFQDIKKDVKIEADLCVVGSGAAGAIIAKEIAETGRRVVLLEAGSYFRPPYYGHNIQEGMEKLYFQRGFRAMLGRRSSIVTMQGRAVGGTTVVNSAISFRLPEWIRTRWASEFGLKFSNTVLDETYARVEKTLNIKPVDPDVQGRNNLLFKQGCDNLGIHSSPIYRNERNCKACGVCLVGCPEGAKLSMDLTYVPWGLKAGMDLYINCQAEKVILEKGEARGIRGRFLEPETDQPGPAIEVRSKLTMISAGVMASPIILLKSGVPNRSKMIGRNLLNHPGTGMLGQFKEVVNAWEGANQGYESSQWAKDGIVLETVWGPSSITSIRLPEFGEKNLAIMKKIKHITSFGAMIRATTTGRVIPTPGSYNPIIYYPINQHDVGLLQRALKYVAEVYFAAGAEAIYPMVYGLPEVITDAKQVKLFEEMKLKPTSVNLIGNHPMGTCRMGEDPGSSVVNSNCESHEVKNLFVCDASIFPTAPGVNPQLTIFAFADMTSQYLKKRL